MVEEGRWAKRGREGGREEAGPEVGHASCSLSFYFLDVGGMGHGEHRPGLILHSAPCSCAPFFFQ